MKFDVGIPEILFLIAFMLAFFGSAFWFLYDEWKKLG